MLGWLNDLLNPTCGVCDKPITGDYGIIQYKPGDSPKICEMKVCDECLGGMYADHKKFSDNVKEWKDEDNKL